VAVESFGCRVADRLRADLTKLTTDRGGAAAGDQDGKSPSAAGAQPLGAAVDLGHVWAQPESSAGSVDAWCDPR
jgi:hypothetical protein